METDEETRMLNPRDVAEILGIHQKTVHNWLRTGKLEGVKISYRSWRISKVSLNDFIEKNKNINKIDRSKDKNSILSDKKSDKNQNSSTNEQRNSSSTNMKDYILDIMGEH
jgi:excisionase family DNA binding protein